MALLSSLPLGKIDEAQWDISIDKATREKRPEQRIRSGPEAFVYNIISILNVISPTV